MDIQWYTLEELQILQHCRFPSGTTMWLSLTWAVVTWRSCLLEALLFIFANNDWQIQHFNFHREIKDSLKGIWSPWWIERLPGFLNLLTTRNFHQVTELQLNESACKRPLVQTSHKSSWYEGIQGCGIQCENPIFDKEEHTRIHRFVGAFGSLSFVCSLFTVVGLLACCLTIREMDSQSFLQLQ